MLKVIFEEQDNLTDFFEYFFMFVIGNKHSHLWHKANRDLLYMCMFIAGINTLAASSFDQNS